MKLSKKIIKKLKLISKQASDKVQNEIIKLVREDLKKQEKDYIDYLIDKLPKE